jgi:MFS family permease
VTSLGFAAIAMRALPHGTRTSKREERTRGHVSAGTSIAADKGFLLFLGAVFLTAAIYMQNASTIALHVTGLGYSTKTYGLLQAMNGVLVVLFELPISSLTQHRNRSHVIALGATLGGAGFAILAFTHALPGLFLMVVVWTLGEIIESPATTAFVADRAPIHARGRYQGALGMMYASAAVAGPLAGTAIYHLDPNMLWLGCGLAGLASAALALEAGRKPIPLHAGST